MRRFISVLLPLILAACTDTSVEPTPGGERLALAGSEDGSVVFVNTDVSPRRSPIEGEVSIPRFVDASALSPDGRLLHVVAFDQLPDRHLLTVDLVQRTVVHRQNLSDRVRDQGPNAATDVGGRSLVVSPDGERLFVPGWTVNGAPMIAALDAHTFERVGTAGPLVVQPGGLAMLPPGEASPAARLVALAQRPGAPAGEAVHLFVVDPESVAIVDSMATPFDRRAVQLLPSPDGRYLYVSDVESISMYDLAERRVTRRAVLPTAGAISISHDGEEIYRADRQYNAVFPGEGRVFVFDRNLIPREDVDLSSYRDGGFPPVISSVVASVDGKRLYVLSGTNRAGILEAYQQTRVFVLDAATRRVERVLELRRWGTGMPHLMPDG